MEGKIALKMHQDMDISNEILIIWLFKWASDGLGLMGEFMAKALALM